MLPNPKPFFADLPDPRRQTRNKLHKLEDIVMITLCAVLGGYEDWVGLGQSCISANTQLAHGLIYVAIAGIKAAGYCHADDKP